MFAGRALAIKLVVKNINLPSRQIYDHLSIAPFLRVKTEKSTCELAPSTTGTLFLCCVRVVNQNTRALLFAAYCYCYAM